MTTQPPKAWVWGFARVAVTTFYRVERIGGLLPDGPLLLVANHPNTLLDPAVIQDTADRRVRFLAKYTLFRRHPLSLLVRHSGAIPVYRKIDPGVDTTCNMEMFRAVGATLDDGEAICLFPEGISHARGFPVTIVPVGLNFDHVAAFRSRVTVVFGWPFDCVDLSEAYGADEQAAVRQLTDRIGRRLRRLAVEAEPRHDLPVVERMDRLYASARGASRDRRERVARRRLIADGLD